MSSAICFNLDQSKILSSGNGLTKIEGPIELVNWGLGELSCTKIQGTRGLVCWASDNLPLQRSRDLRDW